MLAQLILLAAIGQQKLPPPAPVDRVQVVVIDNTKVVNDQNKKIQDLQDAVDKLLKAPCPHCKKLSSEPVEKKLKYAMNDKFGRILENDNYDILVRDINLVNAMSAPGPIPDAPVQRPLNFMTYEQLGSFQSSGGCSTGSCGSSSTGLTGGMRFMRGSSGGGSCSSGGCQ